MTQHSRNVAVCGVVLAAVLGTALHAGHGQGTEWTPTITPVTSPAGPDSAQPQLSVSSRGVLLSWLERTGSRATLKFSERTAAGWSTPVTVASGEDWIVNWADVPSVMRLTNGTLVAHWLQKSATDASGYDVRLAWSKDDGGTWSPSFMPYQGTTGEHGFASLFQMPGAGLGLVWLDGRAKKPAAEHGAHGGDRGPMSLRFASFDASWKAIAEVPVDPRVCDCCPTTAAVTSDGPIAAFRNRSDDEVRDIHIARFEKGTWTASTAVHDDGWKITGCPVNGPMLSARDRDVAIAWFTAAGEQGRAYAAFSKDAGRTFGAPIRLDDAVALGRVDVELLEDGSAIAMWIEFAEEKSQLRVRRLSPAGARSASTAVTTLPGNRASGFPRLARDRDELIFAWTDTGGGTSRVQTAVAMVRAARVGQ